MAVRSSWVNVSVDGRKTDIGTGPASKTGGLMAWFKLRDNGGITDVLTVETRSDGETVKLLVWDENKNLVYQVEKPY